MDRSLHKTYDVKRCREDDCYNSSINAVLILIVRGNCRFRYTMYSTCYWTPYYSTVDMCYDGEGDNNDVKSNDDDYGDNNDDDNDDYGRDDDVVDDSDDNDDDDISVAARLQSHFFSIQSYVSANDASTATLLHDMTS